VAGCNVCLYLDGDDETWCVFDALAKARAVRMALSPMLWTALFWTLSNKFATRWVAMADSDCQCPIDFPVPLGQTGRDQEGDPA
jgi:uncharacterized glyoxalase superfamily protein PhnB